jgi:uncharacterized protein (DUF1015 family)
MRPPPTRSRAFVARARHRASHVPAPEEPLPDIRPFRALRYDPAVVGDLGPIVAPPYDVVGPELERTLLARHPRNAVRLDLPRAEAGDEPDERYRRVARLLAAWRSDGALRKDPRPSLYVYRQAYRVPGSSRERVQTGFFGRLRLEAFGPGSGVLPHERTLAGPREDRYRLLRATGTNTSPVVGLYRDPDGTAAAVLETVTSRQPITEVTDDDGVEHRLWALPDDGDPTGPVATLAAVAGAHPIAIADGHHRYETAIRYRDERRMTRSCEPDPPFDFVLMLFLDAAGELTVLPTHRVVLGLGDEGLARVEAELGTQFAVEPEDADVLVARFAAAGELRGGAGRIGLLTRDRAALLTARESAAAPAGGAALRGLDVSVLGAALEDLAGIDAAALAGGQRIRYTKSAAEAAALLAAGTDGADAVFLLEPTPVASILAVAEDGDVMPQKSTYFYPKALTGLVLNPHEW